LLADREAEEQAGCGRVLRGNQGEGAPCNVEADCKTGLFCPSTKETGVANCAKPAAINQTCYQQQVDSTDHPACQDGLVCLFNTQVTQCPVPPCPEYRCVPRVAANDDPKQAEACTGTDCAGGKSVVCTDLSTAPGPSSHQFVCKNGGSLGAAGAGCNVTEQCATGLYCDTTKGVCAQQKANGQSCNPANNTSIFECQGTCGAGNVCVSFCGKG
jgi:hypothetical protein